MSVSVDGDVGIVTLRRPPHNLLTEPVLRQVADALHGLRGRVRAAVLGSVGRSFCAGADFRSGDAPDPTEEGGFEVQTRAFYLQAARVFESPVPVVAAVQGAAIGAGFGLALACRRPRGGRRWMVPGQLRPAGDPSRLRPQHGPSGRHRPGTRRRALPHRPTAGRRRGRPRSDWRSGPSPPVTRSAPPSRLAGEIAGGRPPGRRRHPGHLAGGSRRHRPRRHAPRIGASRRSWPERPTPSKGWRPCWPVGPPVSSAPDATGGRPGPPVLSRPVRA